MLRAGKKQLTEKQERTVQTDWLPSLERRTFLSRQLHLQTSSGKKNENKEVLLATDGGAANVLHICLFLFSFLFFLRCVSSVGGVSERSGYSRESFPAVKAMQCIPNFTHDNSEHPD